MIWALLQSFVRSFFLQALWNYERMQNVGFAFSLIPLLKRIYPHRTHLVSALRRHIQFFNVHPYLAPVVMGVVYYKEKAMVDAKRDDDPTITILKDTMGGAFGAIGDHVIWGTWRPFCAVMALGVGSLVAFPMVGGTMQYSLFHVPAAEICSKWWVVGFLAMFNSIHIWLRWRGLYRAASEGPLVVRWIESLHLQLWATQIRRLGLLFLAVMVMTYLARWTNSQMLLWMVAVLLGSMIVKRWGGSGFIIFYLTCGVSVTMTLLFHIHWP